MATSSSQSVEDYQLLGSVGLIDDISNLWIARFAPTSELVSVKITDLEQPFDYQFIQEAMDIVLSMQNCRHENITQIQTTFVHEQQLWTVMEPLRIGSCRQLLEERFVTGLPEPICISLMKDTLKAIHYLHEHHFIHNNIRASHLMLDVDGAVKLAGFYQTISMISEGRFKHTVYKFAGDPEWMAPEVLSQATTTNERVDIYSFGMTAMELMYGKNPFEGWPALKILLCKMQYECPPPPSEKSVSRNFKRFYERCLVKNPMKRPSALELLDDPLIKQGNRLAVRQFLSQHYA